MKKLEQMNVRVPIDLHMSMKVEAARNRVALQDLAAAILAWGAREIEAKSKAGQFLLNELDGDDAAGQKPVAAEKPRAAISSDDLPRLSPAGADTQNFFRGKEIEGDAPIPGIRGVYRSQVRGRQKAGVRAKPQNIFQPVC